LFEDIMKYKQSVGSIVALGNAAELVKAVAQQAVGATSAELLDGSPISDEMVMNLAQSSIAQVLAGAKKE
jgi:hypothetical protein